MWKINSLKKRKELIHLNKKRNIKEEEFFSMRKVLKKQGRSSDELEVAISNLTLEELISLKLELSSAASGGRFFGFPLWRNFTLITKDALMRYALSICSTTKQAASFLGMSGDDVLSLVFNWDKQKKLKDSLEELPLYASPLKVLLQERSRLREKELSLPSEEIKAWTDAESLLHETIPDLNDAKIEIMEKEPSWDLEDQSDEEKNSSSFDEGTK